MNRQTIYKVLFLMLVMSFGIRTLAQEVTYSVVENKPYTAKLSIGFTPLELFMLDGSIIAGPGINAYMRPIPRLQVNANLASGLYFKDIEDETNLSGLQKMGGLFLDAGIDYAWYRKGVNFKNPKNEEANYDYKFPVKSEMVDVNTTKDTYLWFPYNRMVERAVRGGGLFYSLPWDKNTKSATGFYVGIAKRSYKSAVIMFEGYGEKKRSDMFGYYFDIMMADGSYIDPMAAGENNIGARFGIDVETVGGIMPVKVNLELGAVPQVGGLVRVRYTFGWQTGKDYYEGDYARRKKMTRKIPAIMQALI